MAEPGMKTLPDVVYNEHECASSADLAGKLAVAVAKALRHGLAERGSASLAVSGGKTPLQFFEALSHETLDWRNVSVTLVDERWLPATSDRSNTRLVLAHLLINKASAAQFIPLLVDSPTPEAGLSAVISGLATLPLPFDAVILGMGDDGHTASWFPNGDNLLQAIDIADKALVLPMRAPAAPEPRITFTAAALLAASNLFLHFETAQKRDVFNRACVDGPATDMPVRAALRTARSEPLNIYWCP